jgi:hypothetical protein
VVAGARETADEDDAWYLRYLDAQDGMLRAVREHAAAGDAMLQLVERHRPTYLAAIETILEVADGEEFAGDDAETAEAIQAELADLLESLDLAEQELETFRQQRRDSGQRVNEAAADAATIFDQRPGT